MASYKLATYQYLLYDTLKIVTILNLRIFIKCEFLSLQKIKKIITIIRFKENGVL